MDWRVQSLRMPKVSRERHATNTQTVFGETLHNGPGPLGGKGGRGLAGLNTLLQQGPLGRGLLCATLILPAKGLPGPVHGLGTTRTRTYNTARSPTGPRLAPSRQ